MTEQAAGEATPLGDPALDRKSERYKELAYEKVLLEERLQKVEEQKSTVSPAIYERVRSEYSKKIEEIDGQKEPLEVEFSEMLTDFRRRRGQAKLERDQRHEAQEEFRFRQSIGEFTPEEATRLEGEHQEAMTALETEIADLDTKVDYLVSIGVGGELAPPEAAHEKVGRTPPAGAGPAEEGPVEEPVRSAGEETGPGPAETPGEVPEAEEVAAPGFQAATGEAGGEEEEPEPVDEPVGTAPSFSGIFSSGPTSEPSEADEPGEATFEELQGEAAGTPAAAFDHPAEETPPGAGEDETEATSPGFSGIWGSGDDPGAVSEEPHAEAGAAAFAAEPAEAVAFESAGAAADDVNATMVGAPARERPTKGYLAVIEGPNNGERFDLIPVTMTLGREPSNTVHLNDTEVSRVHAKIIPRDEAFILQDLDSTNGTYVNDKRIVEVELKDNDHVVLGNSRIIVNLPR